MGGVLGIQCPHDIFFALILGGIFLMTRGGMSEAENYDGMFYK